MKTFNDLVFGTHPYFAGGKQAKIFFENGYGVSVISGKGSYTTSGQWELAVLKGNEADWNLCYDTPVTDDVVGYLSDEDVTGIMEQVQKLPNPTH